MVSYWCPIFCTICLDILLVPLAPLLKSKTFGAYIFSSGIIETYSGIFVCTISLYDIGSNNSNRTLATISIIGAIGSCNNTIDSSIGSSIKMLIVPLELMEALYGFNGISGTNGFNGISQQRWKI